MAATSTPTYSTEVGQEGAEALTMITSPVTHLRQQPHWADAGLRESLRPGGDSPGAAVKMRSGYREEQPHKAQVYQGKRAAARHN